MKIFSSTIFFLLIIIIMGFRIFPDEQILEKIITSFTRYNEPGQEKIYLHFDKPFYSSGETIWYKMYLVDAKTNIPSTLSKVAYVDLVNNKNKVVIRQKLQINKGLASGEISLGENLEEGNFKVVAYTNWMRNFKQDLWFKKDIYIYRPGTETAVTPKLSEPDKLYFFPEGGYLVHDLDSKVGFKAVDKNGSGFPVKGWIQNTSGDTVTTFSSSESGIGTFELQPVKSEIYTAKILFKDTIYREFPLPEPLPRGIVMKVDNLLKEHISVSITGDESTVNNTVYIVAQTKGKIHYQSSALLPSTGNLQLSIPKKSLPEGVCQITLFSSSGEPAAERLVYIDHQNKLNIQISSEKLIYYPREKVTLQLQVKNREGNPLSTNLSLAVTDSQIFGEDLSSDNILSYLNLSSEVKGNIENPARYFGENMAKALDDLLLTQGWRRFTWNEILNGEAPETNFYVEEELSLKGRVMDTSTGKRALGSSVTMTISGDNPQYLFDLTNEKGDFEFQELKLTGPQTFYLKAIEKYSIQENLQIIIDSIAPPVYNFKTTEKISGSSSNEAYLKLIRDTKNIEESFEYFISAGEEVDQDQQQNLKKEALKINYHADELVNMEEYTSFSSMVDVIRELVQGIIIRRKGDQYRLRVLDKVTKFYFKKEPVYLIDGIPVENANEVMNLDPSTVKLITLSKPPDNFYDFGVLGEAGVLAIYTTEMNRNLASSTKTLKVNFKGFDRFREFYAPDYGSKALPVNIPDFRPLLYWNPNILTDKEGKATISFYASDDVTQWQVRVEGLSDSGIPGVGNYNMETKFPEN